MIENALPDDPTPKPLKTTPLDAWHRAHGARMVPFAGYAMPVQYQGVLAEHLHCRDRGRPVRRLAHGPGHADRRHCRSGAGAPGPRRHARPEARPPALHPADQRGRRHHRRPDGRQPRTTTRLFLVVNASRKDVDFAHIATDLAGRCATPAARGPRPAGPARPRRSGGDRSPRPGGRRAAIHGHRRGSAGRHRHA